MRRMAVLAIGLGLVTAATGFSAESLAAGRCATYEIQHEFKFDGSDTVGCLGINAADLAAGSGTIFYTDDYCGGQAKAVEFERSGDRYKLEDFRYTYCQGGAGSADTARVSVKGLTGECFERLDFKWLGARKSYDFVARPTSC